MVPLISAALQSCKTAQVFYVVANMLSAAAFQETQRVWLENTVATPCTRCWVTSAWWDSWGFTHCLVIITRPSKCWRTLSSTRRSGFVEKRRRFSCVCFWWILFTLTWCKAESSYSFSCLVHAHTVPVLFFVFQSMYSRVPECQITTYYYVGFAYLMMRRYQDAIRVFANILLYIQRTRNMFQRSTYKYEMVSPCFLIQIVPTPIIFIFSDPSLQPEVWMCSLTPRCSCWF